MNAQQLAERRRDLHASLDITPYATDTAGEVWALIAKMLFVEGKPRMLALAAELDLSPPQAIVVRLLAEPRTMSELATAMACDNSNVTGIVDRLEERGLVERRPAEDDRRVKLIAATTAGERVRDELNRRIAVAPEPLANLSEKDKRTLRDLLRKAFGE